MRSAKADKALKRIKNFALAIIDPKQGTFLGRKPRDCGLLFAHYSVFFFCLFGISVALFCAHFFTLNINNKLYLAGESSLLRNTPGLSIFSCTERRDSKGLNALFHSDDALDLAKKNHEALLVYRLSNLSRCNLDGQDNRKEGFEKSCVMDTDLLGACSQPIAHAKAFNRSCVYLKVNKVYGWIPAVEKNEIYLNCTASVTNGKSIVKIHYFPSANYKGERVGVIQTAAFPFLGDDQFLSPLLALDFQKFDNDIAAKISCEFLNIPNPDSPPYTFYINFVGKSA